MTTLGLTADANATRSVETPLYDALVAEYRTALRWVPGESDESAPDRTLPGAPRRSLDDGDDDLPESAGALAEPVMGDAPDQDVAGAARPDEQVSDEPDDPDDTQNAARRTRPA